MQSLAAAAAATGGVVVVPWICIGSSHAV